MSTVARPITGLMVGIVAVLLTVLGSTAYASLPPPDPVEAPMAPPPAPVALESSPSFGQELSWMLTGAVVVLLIAAACYGIVVMSRRHRAHTLQLS